MKRAIFVSLAGLAVLALAIGLGGMGRDTPSTQAQDPSNGDGTATGAVGSDAPRGSPLGLFADHLLIGGTEVVLYDGDQLAMDSTVTITLSSGFTVDAGDVARTTWVVIDGQTTPRGGSGDTAGFTGGTGSLTIGPDAFTGADPCPWAAGSNCLWDTLSADVTGEVAAWDTSVTATVTSAPGVTGGADCINHIAQVFATGPEVAMPSEGYVAAGVGLRNQGSGTITIGGIPPGSSIVQAILYWSILDSQVPGGAMTINQNAITGTLISSDQPDPCWVTPAGSGSTFTYRADVTTDVAAAGGNGSYTLSGYPTGSTSGLDPWDNPSPTPMMEGASLIVIFQPAGPPPMPPEINEFDLLVEVSLQCLEGSEDIRLEGEITTHRDYDSLADVDPPNGQQEIQTRILAMSLSGHSELLGDLVVTKRSPAKHPYQDSTGEIEEDANNDLEKLDIDPIASGTGKSRLDVYFEAQGDATILHNATGFPIIADVENLEWPLAYEAAPDGDPIVVLDENNQPVGCEVTGMAVLIMPPFPEETTYSLHVDATLECSAAEPVALDGWITTDDDLLSLADGDGDGLQEIQTEIISMELTGSSPALGPIEVRLRPDTKHPNQKSEGEVEEQANNTPFLDILPYFPGTADSFFDVFFELEATALGLLLHNHDPLRVEAEITDLYEPAMYSGVTEEIPGEWPLYDEQENPSDCRVSDMSASAAPSVGGMTELFVGPSGAPASAAGESGSSAPLRAAISGAAAAAAFVLVAGGWYARRRWVR